MFGVQRQKPERTRYVWGRWEMRQSKKRTHSGDVMAGGVVVGGETGYEYVEHRYTRTHVQTQTGSPCHCLWLGVGQLVCRFHHELVEKIKKDVDRVEGTPSGNRTETITQTRTLMDWKD